MVKNLICLLFSTVCFFSINAQDLDFGFKAGANFATLVGDGISNASSRTGFHLGAVAKIGITGKFGIQPELIYSQQGAIDEIDTTLKLDYLSVPVLGNFKVAPGFSLQVGPQFGINLASSTEDSAGNEIDVEGINSVDVGAAVGAQLKLPLGLFFQARYGLGLNDIVEDSEAKNSNISVSIGYFFL